MKTLINLKTAIPAVLASALIICLEPLPPNAFGVVPAPDGGYAGLNTAEGQDALLSLTTGSANTAVGWLSLKSNQDTSFNTAVGAGALLLNTADENTATGAGALLSNTAGGGNTANGAFALLNNATGFGNTATGLSALFINITGSDNTAIGTFALLGNTEGSSNTAVGRDALSSNTAHNNTAIGRSALGSNTTGTQNTASGVAALASNTTGSYNTAVGLGALESNTTSDNSTAIGINALLYSTGGFNTACGANALLGNTSGTQNTAVGLGALNANSTGDSNTAIGVNALERNTTGRTNITVGASAGFLLTTGDLNIDIGNTGQADDFHTIRIGSANHTRSFIAGIRGVTTGIPDAVNVVIDSDGQLGTVSSSRRFKKEIKPMDKASEALLTLKPVTFHYKSDATRTPQFGLIAEEVADVNPDLVVRDKNGEIYTVRYDAVNAMLLNEFLKQHQGFLDEQRTVQEQGATIVDLKKEIASLTTTVKKQATQIHRVSAQIELNRPAIQQVVLKTP